MFQVEFETPAKKRSTKYILESILLAIWGQVHDCRIVYEAPDRDFCIYHTGFGTAASLFEGEAIPKFVSILTVCVDTNFELDSIPLQTTRPRVFITIATSD